MVKNVKAFLFASHTGDAFGDFGLLLMRLVFGLSLAFGHGQQKLPPSDQFVSAVERMGFPMPTVFAWAASLSEFVGGLLIAAGLLTRPAALFAGITMAVAAFVAGAGNPFDKNEKAILFLAAAAGLFFMGSGRYGLDSLAARKR
jgi:putative oxidoreductase